MEKNEKPKKIEKKSLKNWARAVRIKFAFGE